MLGILLGTALPAAPAGAHGALENPASRATGCEPGRGAERSSTACRAAAKVSGAALAEWDELRVPNVNGRDRRMIPDGELCSAGIERFRGLDLPRADWPATRLTAAARHTFRYRVSIPTGAVSGCTSPATATGPPARSPGRRWRPSRS